MGHAARGGRGMFTHYVGATTVELTALVHSNGNVDHSHFLRPLDTCKLQSRSTLFILCIKRMYGTLTTQIHSVCQCVNEQSFLCLVRQMLYSSVYYLVTRRCNVTKILNIFHVTEISHVNSWITCYVVSQCIYVYSRICPACVAVSQPRQTNGSIYTSNRSTCVRQTITYIGCFYSIRAVFGSTRPFVQRQ